MPTLSAVFRTMVGTFSSESVYAAAALTFLLLVLAWLLAPRRVYFVRHGETEANTRRVRQGPEGSLSETGRAQAAATGGYLARFPIKEIVASPQERVRETAEIINETLRVPLSFSALLVERRNPSEAIGKSEDDPAIRVIMDQIDRTYHKDDYRYSDEENFTELKARAKQTLDLFARQGSRHTLAVTHSIFLKMVVAYLLYRDRLHAGEYAKLSFFNVSDNAGITIVEYAPWKRWNRTRGWRILEYNVTPYLSRSDLVPRTPSLVS